MKSKPCFLLAALLCAPSAFAQGIIQFNWHGNENLFQASFQIYDYEMAPGTWFSGTHLFDQTLTVTSPDHAWAPGTSVSYTSGFTGPGSALYLDAIPTFATGGEWF
jgi:hypothetical protein